MADPIIDALMKPLALPRILRGGPYGVNGAWIVEVQVTVLDLAHAKTLGLEASVFNTWSGLPREIVTLTRAQLAEWRDRA